ncbi:hypothetical protein SEVIR_5G264750v4 [Setaria viridis]
MAPSQQSPDLNPGSPYPRPVKSWAAGWGAAAGVVPTTTAERSVVRRVWAIAARAKPQVLVTTCPSDGSSRPCAAAPSGSDRGGGGGGGGSQGRPFYGSDYASRAAERTVIRGETRQPVLTEIDRDGLVSAAAFEYHQQGWERSRIDLGQSK